MSERNLMFCTKCGSPLPDGAVFCPSCGNHQGTYAPPYGDPAFGDTSVPFTECPPVDNRKPLREMASSGMFLAVCILLTVSLAASFFAGGINVLLLLCVIGIWMMYSSATSSAKGLMLKGLKLITVSLNIQYVLFYVAFVMFLIAGILVLFLDAFNAALFEELPIIVRVNAIADGNKYLTDIVNIPFIVTLTVVVAAVLILVLNLVFTKAFRDRMKDISTAYENNTAIRINHKSFAVKLLIFGILFCSSAANSNGVNSSLLTISDGCMIAASIISFIMIRRQEKTY